jgi:alginate O-acetyltransferase complex protein AlgI
MRGSARSLFPDKSSSISPVTPPRPSAPRCASAFHCPTTSASRTRPSAFPISAAIGFSDFWRRWHISLSTWLRDYLYVPLGGNRKGPTRTYINLMITMLLGGLWHGANWTFVVWGGLHGLYLSAERLLRGVLPKDLKLYRTFGFNIAMALLTYVLVNITWVFFRAQSIEQAFGVLGSMFSLQPGAQTVLYYNDIVPALVVVTGMVTAHWLMRTRSIEQILARTPQWALAAAWSAMLFGLVITQGSDSAFIYFQF